ncbi:MAG: formimidoylglutamate deiminase [Mycobacteriales bacterium]
MPVSRWHADLAWTGRPAARVLIEADGGRITRVSADVDPPPDAVRLAGITVPGLANAHSHAFHRALRGRTHTGAGDFWTWREQMYAVASRLNPDSYYALARATYAEMALAGITAVGEFHYLHHQPGGRPYADPNEMSHALARAAADAGVRLTVLDTCYLQADVDGRPLDGAQLRFTDGDADGWAARVDQLAERDPVRVGAAIHSVRAVDRAAMESVAAWAADREAPLHVHLSEQRSENAACSAVHGATPTALLADAGVLGERSTAIHATHLEAADIELLGGSGTSVCLCPTTERDLADGVGPAARLVAAGSPLCLGTDSSALIDIFEEARAVELDERLVTERRGHHRAEALLDAATAAGMAALGWDAGRLEPGALADFVTLRTDSPRLAGVDPESLAAFVVFAASACDVSSVVVGGREVVAQGRHLGVPDVAAELAAAIRPLAGAPGAR